MALPKSTQSPFLVTHHPLLGQQFIASRDLKAGELILRESPLIAIPSWPNDPTFDRLVACLTCASVIQLDHQNNNNYLTHKKCTGCTWPVCNVDCEEDPIHASNECKIFSTLAFHFPPSTATFTPKRIDWLIFAVRVSFLKKRQPTIYQKLFDLKHVPDLPLPGEMNEMLKLASDTVTTCPPFLEGDPTEGNGGLGLTKEEMTRLIWIFKLNGFTCATTHQEETDEDDVIGEEDERVKIRRPSATMDCIYLTTSRMNNSCSPNSAYLTNTKFPHLDIVIKTAIEVKKGQPLTINYFPYHHLPTHVRRQKIRESFLFNCQCERCLDPTEMGTYMSAILCQFCHPAEEEEEEEENDLGYFLPSNDYHNYDGGPHDDDDDRNEPIIIDDESVVWTCNKCGGSQHGFEFPSLLGLQKIVQELKPADHGECDDDDDDAAEGLRHRQDEEFLKNLIAGHRKNYGLHPNHWIFQMALDKLVTFYKNLATHRPLTEFELECCKKYSLHNLQIQGKLFPGRSIVTACLQLDLCTALFEKNLMTPNNNNSAHSVDDGEKYENAKLCLKLAGEALTVFESFKNEDASGYYQLCHEFLTVVIKSGEEEEELFKTEG